MAADAQAQSVFDGFYGGATVGYYHFNADNFKDDFVACCSTGTNFGGNQSGDSVNIGVLGGYGLTFDRYYVGAEANGSFNVHANTGAFAVNNIGDTTLGVCRGAMEGIARVTSQHSFGVGPRFGYLITPTILGFVKAGVQATEFTAQYTELKCDSPNVPQQGKLVWGAQLSGGADIAIGTWDWPHAPVFLRLEYDHTFFPSTSFSYHITGGEGHVLHFNPSEDIAKVGLVIKFGGP